MLLEAAVMGWAWVTIARRLGGLRVPPVHEAGLALVVFALNLYTFPLMARHTLDSLVFPSVGLEPTLELYR